MRFLMVSSAVLMTVSVVRQPCAAETERSSGANGLPPVVAVTGAIAIPTATSIPVLQHVVAAGASVTELGTAHGMRTVVARHGAEFMVLAVPGDGQVAVAGIAADLPVAQLRSIAGSQLTDLGVAHGMSVLFVRNGDQFQIFYGTPDGERVIPGVMWDAHGKNLTREQIASIEGTIPTVVIGPDKNASGVSNTTAPPGPTSQGATSASLLGLVTDTHYGTYGRAGAPRLWVFIDPLCSYSIRAMAALEPYAASGRVELAVIPLAVLDYEDQNRSTPSALGMLSKPQGEMVAAWRSKGLDVPAAPGAAAALRANMKVAEAIGLRGTPTLVWKKADGTEGRVDGVPQDLEAVISSMEKVSP
jgi:thiol:disulfide interchange protein DsbG